MAAKGCEEEDCSAELQEGLGELGDELFAFDSVLCFACTSSPLQKCLSTAMACLSRAVTCLSQAVACLSRAVASLSWAVACLFTEALMERGRQWPEIAKGSWDFERNPCRVMRRIGGVQADTP